GGLGRGAGGARVVHGAGGVTLAAPRASAGTNRIRGTGVAGRPGRVAECAARARVHRRPEGTGLVMVLAKLGKPLLPCALAAMEPACSFGVQGGATVGVPAALGSLTVKWTVTGAASPSACSAAGGDTVEVIVYDAAGNEVASTNAPCEWFAVTFHLLEGS